MPIIERNSPLSGLRTELQNVISNYSPEMIEKVLQEMGMVPSIIEEKQYNPSFEEAANYYLSSSSFLGLSTSSKKTYVSELSQFSHHVKCTFETGATLREVTEPSYLVSYLDRFSHIHTKSKKSAFLRTLFKVSLKHFYNENLDDLNKILKLNWRRDSEVTIDSLPKPLTLVQLSEVLRLSAATRNGLRNHAILMTFLTSGIRLNELIQLQIGDLVADDKSLAVIPKGNEKIKVIRTINLLGIALIQNYINFTYSSQKLKLPIEEYRKLYIFSASNGNRPLDSRTIGTFVANIYDQCESIPKIRNGRRRPYNVHTLRHCFAVYGLEKGLDIFTISKLLGHKDIKSTAIYLDLFNNQLSKAIERHPFAKEIGDE
ncbi:tyrosine-type recombinase/integrase [Paenibacillus glycinis]|uniref:Tyrosine-type recombinase/integrase n=1 Tax=Paenibacillus glycinis TaxID=2697035 RepID=A0ABW9XZG7_9BACL|nr:tyrosine-type recombinase/integrase [Paenibacillus glycinis]NBD28000.1 tyrosine-type recombinase/integrase [Paenibacillus glycinis]